MAATLRPNSDLEAGRLTGIGPVTAPFPFLHRRPGISGWSSTSQPLSRRNSSGDAGHGLGGNDIQTTEKTRYSNKLEHIVEIELSVKKSECSFFTTNMHEARWRTAPYLSKQQIKYNPNPNFLRITYVSQLIIGLHASIVGSKLEHCGARRQQTGAMRNLSYAPPT